MIRLAKNNLNSPERTYSIYETIWKKELHYIDWKRFALLVKHYQEEKGKYLDIGCFNSPMPLELVKTYRNQEITAVDYCGKLIDELKERHPEVNYLWADAEKLPFENEYFDYIVIGELIEHTEDPAKIVREAMRVLKKGGWLAISTPNDEANGNAVSGEHLWSFTMDDVIDLISPYGEVEINYCNDSIKVIVAFCKKYA
jgi:ubiquinone/menaquinone biosynthesis C-methylase UbiE